MESDFFFKALYDYSQLVTIVHCLDFSVDTDAYTGLYLDQPWQQHHRGRNHAMQGQWFGGCGMTYAFRTTSAMKTWWILLFFRHIPRAVRLALEQWRLNLSRILVNFGKSTAEAHILSPNAAILGASG